jgi:hypothetical protein
MDAIADRIRELLLRAREAEQRAAGYRAEAARLVQDVGQGVAARRIGSEGSARASDAGGRAAAGR